MVNIDRYEAICKTENLNTLIKLGILPLTVLDYKVIYEYYKEERKCNNKKESEFNTAEEFRISERTVRRVAVWMQGF